MENTILNLIERFLHLTTEPFDSWEWDGSELLIIHKEKIIERYSKQELFEIWDL